MSDDNSQYVNAELAELRAQIAALEAQVSQSHGDTSSELDGRVSAVENALQAVERKWASLRGQDGVAINRNVIGGDLNYGSSTRQNRQTAIFTLCVNGAPGYAVLPVEQPPTPF